PTTMWKKYALSYSSSVRPVKPTTPEFSSLRRVTRGQSLPKIQICHLLTCYQLGAGSLEAIAPGYEDVAIIGTFQRHARVLLDHQHRYTGVADAQDALPYTERDPGGQSRRRLIQQ